jgi:hypothetical protein
MPAEPRTLAWAGWAARGTTCCQDRWVTEDEFWDIVERSRRQTRGRIEHQPAALEKLLAGLPPQDVLAFRGHLLDLNDRAYTWPFAAAVHLRLGGVGDDAFTNLRTWLICHGRETFERILADPDTLADLPLDPDIGLGFAEEFGYVPDEVYEQLTGDEAPDETDGTPVDEAPVGEPIDLADLNGLRERFPRLAARVADRR